MHDEFDPSFQDKFPVDVDFKYSNKCKCMMRIIYQVQDKIPVEVDFKYCNECKCMM
jgi:hypothetical protein